MKYEHMGLFRLKQIWALSKMMVARVVAMFYSDHHPIWLICDRGTGAGDNGYKFFLYMKKNHPDTETHYIISKHSPERHLLADYEDSLLDFRSLRHYIYLWRATHLMSTHVQGYFPYVGLGLFVQKIYPFYARKKHIFLQHGVSKDYTPFLEYSNTQVDLVMTAVKPEYDFFINRYSYPKEKVVLTGMCRFDQLEDESQNRRQILLIPTWREYIYKSEGFENTDYYKAYASLITSKRLQTLLEERDWRMVFYPHHEMQRYLKHFTSLPISDRIHIVAEGSCDLQSLFRESSLMITDYSSVYFDFSYMYKPVLLYQFDREQFQGGHYEQGWLDYDHSFGPVCTQESVLLEALEELIDNQLNPKEEYKQFSANLYPFRDRQNCERNYCAILALDKRM